MKINSSARRFVKIRSIVFCLALIGMVGIAFSLGEFLAGRVGRIPAPQTEVQPVPNASIADLMFAAR
jgi:hypothetical protein